VTLGSAWAERLDAGALLVTLGDLPFISAGEVRALIARGTALARQAAPGRRGAAVLAPDRSGTGTNALFVAPPGALPFAFGAGSRQRFEALAAQAGVVIEVFDSPGTAFDVDGADDLALLRRRMHWPLAGLGGIPPLRRGRDHERTA
jgi:2-phospho-L-lactate guanylyltransferase (CobY/MobA/RfbA family)